MMETIDILLASYNGSRFIENQILSIIGQTYKNWILYIHDDGSSDNTLDIIRKYEKLDSRIKLIDDGVSLKGPGANFMHMLGVSQAKFICFCDQDDLWLEYKLEVLLSEIISKDNSIPQVVYGNGYTWFPESYYMGRNSASVYPHSLQDLFFFNGGYQGASAIFNIKMKECIDKKYTYIAMHDQILNLAGVLFGNIHYVNKSLFLYRQHSSNFTPHIVQNGIERFERIIHNLKVPVLEEAYYLGIKSFYDIHKSKMKSCDIELFDCFLEYPNKRAFWRFISILKYGYKVNNSRIYLLIKLLIRPFLIKSGKY